LTAVGGPGSRLTAAEPDATVKYVRHTLIVANRTASTPVLLQEVERRNALRTTAFTLLVPTARDRPDWSMDDALRELRKAARGPHGTLAAHVDGISAGDDPFEAVKDALETGEYHDVIISTLPKRTSEWLKNDLPSRVEALGVPVTVITPPAGHGFSLFAKGAGQHERSD
jgi:hypothetical protein